MHIPDGLLATPVWLSLDVAAVPTVAYMGRKLVEAGEDSKAPLLGVMGAFVFAAQMINFPVGPGVSSHLLGSALLTFTLGPAAAAVVMTAVLTLQALIFQDGGVLALGANIFNMAIIGVLVAYTPYRLAGAGSLRAAWVFLGAFLSVFVAAGFALAELFLSGARIPAPATFAAIVLFFATAVAEGLITVAVVRAAGTFHPDWGREPSRPRRPVVAALSACAIVTATVGALFASGHPDVLESLTERAGVLVNARQLFETPLAGYETALFDTPWLNQSAAGAAGLAAIFLVCLLISRLLARRRSR